VNVLIGVGALLIVLGVLVFVHEAGHFIAAKLSGIYVHRFSLGLGAPVKALSFVKGETEYVISWLPLGGYVKMASREEEATSSMLEGGKATAPVPPDRVFEAKPVWKRMIVILAGVTMNTLFALGVFTYLAAKHGEQIVTTTRVGIVDTTGFPATASELRRLAPGDRITAVNGVPAQSWNDVERLLQWSPGPRLVVSVDGKGDLTAPISADDLESRLAIAQSIGAYQLPVLDTILPDTPAKRAGLASGDTVIAVNGEPVAQWYDLVQVIQSNGGKALAFELGTATGRKQVSLTPTPTAVPDDSGKGTHQVGKIGAGPKVDARAEKYSLGGAVKAGARQTLAASTLIVRSIKGMVKGMVSPRNLGGPIAIGSMAGQSIRLGADVFLSFMALISVNLAVLNLLPIPVLDGGQFVFLLAEGITRKPLSLKLRERLTAVGLVLIVLLMVFAFSNDILKWFGI
jgi:regulator of sigma E protease